MPANPETIHQKVKAKNPNYNGQAQFANDSAVGLIGDFSGTSIIDLSPLRGIPFGALDLKGQPVSNLEALRGMPLKLLGLEETKVVDLTPLTGMKIEKLYLSNTAVSNLKPLADMPLQELMLVGTKVKDLSPLRGAPLQALWLNGTPVADILPLAGCPLVSLTLQGTNVSRPGPTLQNDDSAAAAHRRDTRKRSHSAQRAQAYTADLHAFENHQRPGCGAKHEDPYGDRRYP